MAKTEAGFHQATQVVADTIKTQITIADGIAKLADGAYESTLAAADLDIETVKRVQKHNQRFTAGTMLAVGEAAVDHMAANKAVDSVSVKTAVGLDTMHATFERSAEVKAGVGKDSTEKKTIYGCKSVPGYSVAGTSELKNIRAHIRARGAELLAS